ncbi:unnamed protein product, partial [Durusdinium trenchii]
QSRLLGYLAPLLDRVKTERRKNTEPFDRWTWADSTDAGLFEFRRRWAATETVLVLVPTRRSAEKAYMTS